MSNGASTQPPLTPDQFRNLFPAFADPTRFSDALIQTWLDLAPLDPCVWGDRYQIGQGLWTAHELYKFGPGGLMTAAPGSHTLVSGLQGAVSNKSVGPVSVGYDLNLTKIEGAGPYNASMYGQQFWQIAMSLPVGPYQIGAATPNPWGSGPWVGPWPYPAASGFSS